MTIISIGGDYSTVNQSNIERFAELELIRITRKRMKYHNGNRAQTALHLLHEARIVLDAEEEGQLLNVLFLPRFFNPLKEELVLYMLHHEQSYSKTQQFTGVSAPTISKIKKNPPTIRPMFRYWTPDRLRQWDEYKKLYNIWEPLPIQNQ
jgi:uncharacterized protein YerC